jgi:hypothetical protein
MAFQSPFLTANANSGLAANEPMIIPPHGTDNVGRLFSSYAEGLSPVNSPRRHPYFQHHSSPNPTTASLIDGLVRMEEAAAVSRMATHIAMARFGAAAAAQQQQRQQAATFLNMQQPRVVSPIKQRRSTCNPPASLPGLNLLGAAATIQHSVSMSPGVSSANSVTSIASLRSTPTPPLNHTASTGSIENLDTINIQEEHETCNDNKGRFYIDSISANDVLCGRGGRSNHHTGNKRYRQVVGHMKYAYQQCPAKTLKTDLSRAIVEHCCSYGARFVKQDEAAGKYYVLTKAEARKKTSQALRETKAIKWIA